MIRLAAPGKPGQGFGRATALCGLGCRQCQWLALEIRLEQAHTAFTRARDVLVKRFGPQRYLCSSVGPVAVSLLGDSNLSPFAARQSPTEQEQHGNDGTGEKCQCAGLRNSGRPRHTPARSRG